MFWFFDCEARGIFAPWPGIELAPPALESEVWSTGLPGKSPDNQFLEGSRHTANEFFNGILSVETDLVNTMKQSVMKPCKWYSDGGD